MNTFHFSLSGTRGALKGQLISAQRQRLGEENEK